MRKARKVDLSRYLGKWYQVTAFPAWFQKGCKNITAEYELKDDYIQVKNTCIKNGKKEVAIAKAFPTKKDNVLKVQFAWPIKSDYVIEYVDTGYQYAIVGSNLKRYCWILSRKKRVSGKMKEYLMKKAGSMGYDVSKFE